MRKYTVIYGEPIAIGSHRNLVVKVKYLECLQNKLKETLEEEIGTEKVLFVFEGYSEQVSF